MTPENWHDYEDFFEGKTIRGKTIKNANDWQKL